MGGARAGGYPPGAVRKRLWPRLCVSVCHQEHHFRLRSGQAPKGKAAAARRRPLSLRCPLPQVYYYSTGRAASPRPWQRAGLCSALAAFSLGAPPNRLLHLLICLKSHRTSRRRSPPGAGRPCRVCAPVLGGGAGRRAQLRAPLSPGPGGHSGGGRARGGPGCAHVGRPPTGPELPIPAE